MRARGRTVHNPLTTSGDNGAARKARLVGGAVRSAAVRIGTLIATHCWGRGSLRISLSLVSLSAFLLLGCEAEYSQHDGNPRSARGVIPLPERALLQPQGEPGCELKPLQEEGGEGAEQRGKPPPPRPANLADHEPSVPSGGRPPAPPSESIRKLGQVDSNPALGLRVRLEYERDCFRRAEMQARDRLHRLQAAVGKTIKTVKRIERNGF